MALPNLGLLEQINKAVADLKTLETKKQDLEDKVSSIKNDLSFQESNLVTSFENKEKQRLLLEKIETELDSLRESEKQLRNTVTLTINIYLDNFFNQGDFKAYISSLLTKLRTKSDSVAIKASEDTKKYIPEGENTEEVKENGLLRIVMDYKSYILDPETLKKQLHNQLLQDKVSGLKYNFAA